MLFNWIHDIMQQQSTPHHTYSATHQPQHSPGSQTTLGDMQHKPNSVKALKPACAAADDAVIDNLNALSTAAESHIAARQENAPIAIQSQSSTTTTHTLETVSNSIGLGIVPNVVRKRGGEETLNANATEAACKAVQDALDRSILALSTSKTADAGPDSHLMVYLGVPAQLSDPSEPIQLQSDQVREHVVKRLEDRKFSIKVQVSLGGLWTEHFNPNCEGTENKGTLTVVASLSVLRDHQGSRHETPSSASSRTLLSAQQQEPPMISEMASPSATREFHKSSSMDVLAHVSAEICDQRTQQHKLPQANASFEASDPRLTSVGNSSTGSHDSKEAPAMSYGDKYGNNTNYKKLPPGKTPKNNNRLFVQHSYKDYSQEVPESAEEHQAFAESSLQKKTPNAAFPLKLHETLAEIERDGHDDIIGWLPHGRSFKIHKQQEFVELILPKYFVMTKKSSFLRQLNLYSFNRLSGVGPDQASYYHEKFLRGMKFLCCRMQRCKVNGNRIRAAGNPDNEPVLSNYHVCPAERVAREGRPASEQHPLHQAIDPAHALIQQRQDVATAAVLQYMAKHKQQQQQQQLHQFSHPTGTESALALLGLVQSPPQVNNTPGNNGMLSVGASAVAAPMSRSLLRRRQLPISENEVSSSPKKAARSSPVSSPTAESKGEANGSNHPPSSTTVGFPLKLQRILDKLEAEGNTNIISWLPHGRAFMVHIPNRFVQELMPLYFNQTKYSSFQRQLHMYNFSRITTGRDKGAYHHPQFLRGQPVLCQKMQRTRVNGKGTRQPGNPKTEPDFYRLESMPGIAPGSEVEIPSHVLVFSNSEKSAGSTVASSSASLFTQKRRQGAPSVSSSSTRTESDEEV